MSSPEFHPGAGRYIQKHPQHGPGGIDFSLRPGCVAQLLRLVAGSPLAPAVQGALAPAVERRSAQQLMDELERIEV